MPNFKDAAYIQAAAAAPFVYPYSRHASSPGEVFGYGNHGGQGQLRYGSPAEETGNFFGNTSAGSFESSWQHNYQAKCEPPDYATVAATMAAAAVCRQAQYFEDFYSRKRSGKNKGRLRNSYIHKKKDSNLISCLIALSSMFACSLVCGSFHLTSLMLLR